jgi:hypothetical protein
VFITAGPSTKLFAGTREEPGTRLLGGALFSLVPLVWDSNPKLQGVCVYYCRTSYKTVCVGAGARPNHQPFGGSDPNHQGIWSPPRAGQLLEFNVCCVYYCST